MSFSKRIDELKESPIRKLAPIADASIQKGRTIYYLNIGQPDIATPPTFFDAIQQVDMKIVKYAPSRGIKELIQSIQTYYHGFGIDWGSNDILVTSGASEAILFAISVICNPGDEVLMPEPFYVNTANFVDQLSGRVVPIPTSEKDGYHLPSMEDIEKLITAKTKAILITHPNNPTGTVYKEVELQMIKELALKHNLFIIADEVYRTIAFDSTKAKSFGNLGGLEDNLILVDSVSKRYSSCGARIGALLSKNKQFMKYAMKLAEARLSVSSIDQIGASALYKMNPHYYEEIANVYQSRRDVVLEELNKIPGISFSHPEGAFYILVGFPIEDAEHFAKWLLEEFHVNGETVFVAPAKDFYLNPLLGKNQVRLAYVYEEKTLRKAVRLLGEGLKKYLELK